MNPSLSAINQDIISISDYFILPTSPDYFSHMAIRSMARILPIWENWAIQARTAFADSTYPMPVVKPKFLGYTVNDYNIRNGLPTAAFSSIISRTNEIIETTLYPALSAVGMTIDKNNYPDGNLCLASLSNFQHLMPKYQQYGLPVFALTPEQIGTKGAVLEGHLQKQADFNQVYEIFANNVIRLTSI